MGRKGQTRQDLAPADLRALQNEWEAFDLRVSGASFRAIGEVLGMSGEGARQAVKRAVGRIRAELEEHPSDMKIAMVERNQGMKVRFFKSALAGDEKAAITVMRLDNSLADLLGLKAPRRSIPTQAENMTEEEIEETRAELEELIALDVEERVAERIAEWQAKQIEPPKPREPRNAG